MTRLARHELAFLINAQRERASAEIRRHRSQPGAIRQALHAVRVSPVIVPAAVDGILLEGRLEDAIARFRRPIVYSVW